MARPRKTHRVYDDPEMDAVAKAIDAHLQRIEADPRKNHSEETLWGMQSMFDNASAKAEDEIRAVGIRYWNWGPRYLLRKEQAKAYLARLERGHAGRHDD